MDSTRSATSELERLHTFVGFPDDVKERPTTLARLGFRYVAETGRVVCSQCRLELHNLHEIVSAHKERSPQCGIGLQDTGEPDFDRLRSERIRLETFDDSPPTAARVFHRHDMQVEAGLFRTGQPDRDQGNVAFQQDEHANASNVLPLVGGQRHPTSEHTVRSTMEPTVPTCRVCRDNKVTTFFVPCGHVICDACKPEIVRLDRCHMCREYIAGAHPIDFST